MSIRIVKAGVLDTVQDAGRHGYSHWGINPGGVMDSFAASVANWLVGNQESTAVLEMHFPAPMLRFEKDALIALCGADLSPAINDVPVSNWQPLLIKKDAVLSFRKPVWGARCYLSLKGGFSIDPWLHSYSTNLVVHAGGWRGDKLQTEDAIPFEGNNLPVNALHASNTNFMRLPWKVKYEHIYDIDERIPFTSGPEWDQLSEQSRILMVKSAFEIGSSSDRMGYQLDGPELFREKNVQMISSGVTFGTMQLLPGGKMIILMADHQTTGGYPRLGFIAGTYLPRLAQSGIRSVLYFQLINLIEANQMMADRLRENQLLKKNCFENLNSFYAMHGYQL